MDWGLESRIGDVNRMTVARERGREHGRRRNLTRHLYIHRAFMKHTEVIAHRGASAYAPENTMSSFELAVRLEAGCLEHDLQVTKDGVLVCLHDRTLERTTNVRDVFASRGREVDDGAETTRRWFVHDFTLAEIQELDAGSWFKPECAGARVPTFDDLLEWTRNRVAVLTELKDLEAYETLGVDPLTLCIAALRRHGRLSGPVDWAGDCPVLS